MKRFSIILLLITVLAVPLYAARMGARFSQPSSEDISVATGAGVIYGIQVRTGGTNAAQILLLDSPRADAVTGEVVKRLGIEHYITTSANDREQFVPLHGMAFEKGIYAVVTVAGQDGFKFSVLYNYKSDIE